MSPQENKENGINGMTNGTNNSNGTNYNDTKNNEVEENRSISPSSQQQPSNKTVQQVVCPQWKN